MRPPPFKMVMVTKGETNIVPALGLEWVFKKKIIIIIDKIKRGKRDTPIHTLWGGAYQGPTTGGRIII